MLTTKEFNGNEFHAFCQQEYDAARRFLKSCGKPQDACDRFLIEQAKLSASVFGNMLDSRDAIAKLNRTASLHNKRDALIRELHKLDVLLQESQLNDC